MKGKKLTANVGWIGERILGYYHGERQTGNTIMARDKQATETNNDTVPTQATSDWIYNDGKRTTASRSCPNNASYTNQSEYANDACHRCSEDDDDACPTYTEDDDDACPTECGSHTAFDGLL